ncbi:MAG: ABC transporter permease subunit [Actinobacteria bacterium]|uniref:ABC transporter permease subunit n=1 Tax=Candidatus Fonsibacter lacus TaxID=2576439 RepID=A0A965GD38_9PROT|nr:ABC transporter permease subunit [Candidatus Fonsibacter lacus]
MTEKAMVQKGAEMDPRAFPKLFARAHLPALPFLIIFAFFFLFPIARLIYISFLSNDNQFTISNFQTALEDPYRTGLFNSIKIGLISAALAAFPGALAAYFIETYGPSKLRRTISVMTGVLANTGGVPLAFMFTAALGIQGQLTKVLKAAGWDIYSGYFSLGTFKGLLIVYLYFQLPLMIIVFSPAILALRREWEEAAKNLGANSLNYWKKIGIPLLIPSFIGSFLLLFASGFSAYATANALTVGNLPLTPLQIGGLLDGNVSASQLHLGKALGVMMILISALAVIPYLLIQRRVSRWQIR